MNITYTDMDTCPVLTVAIHGHVWISKGLVIDGDNITLTHARIVRAWGTTKGLNELVRGPTSETVIDDPAPLVFLPNHAVIAIIPCTASAWEGKL